MRGGTLVRETGSLDNHEKPGLSKSWLSMFGGKPNTEEVLRKKAEALAQLVIVNGEAGRELASKLGKVPEGGEQANQVSTEMMMFTIHVADRMASRYLQEPQRALFVGSLIESTILALAQRNKVQIDTPAFEGMSSNFIGTFNARQNEYGDYRLWLDPGRGAKGELFWEFGEKIAHTLGADMDAAIVVPVENYAVKMIARLYLKELLLGKSE